MARYKLLNENDSNHEIELKSPTEKEATAEAFEILGWHLVKTEEKVDYTFCEDHCEFQTVCERVTFTDCPLHPSNKTEEKL